MSDPKPQLVPVARPDVDRLREWLEDPKGALRLRRVMFQAEFGGAIWVRTKPPVRESVGRCPECRSSLYGDFFDCVQCGWGAPS